MNLQLRFSKTKIGILKLLFYGNNRKMHYFLHKKLSCVYPRSRHNFQELKTTTILKNRQIRHCVRALKTKTSPWTLCSYYIMCDASKTILFFIFFLNSQKLILNGISMMFYYIIHSIIIVLFTCVFTSPRTCT